MSVPPRGRTLHGGCVVLREAGILLRGPSGSGKSTLARGLVAAARTCGHFAAHVADDRVRLRVRHGRLVARPVPAIAGRMEMRGFGIVAVPHEPAAVIRLVVDLGPDAPARLPEPDELRVTILGVVLHRIAATPARALDLVPWALRCQDDTFVTDL